jgi:hypothetical protein
MVRPVISYSLSPEIFYFAENNVNSKYSTAAVTVAQLNDLRFTLYSKVSLCNAISGGRIPKVFPEQERNNGVLKGSFLNLGYKIYSCSFLSKPGILAKLSKALVLL